MWRGVASVGRGDDRSAHADSHTGATHLVPAAGGSPGHADGQPMADGSVAGRGGPAVRSPVGTALSAAVQGAARPPDNSDQGRKLDVVLVEADFRDAAGPRSPLREGYPPPSIYLIPSLEPWTPHVVTYYLLLHISATIFHDYRPVKEKLKCFPSPFHLSTDVQSLVEDIWHLDHGNHEERVECLQQAQQQASAALRPLLDALWAPDVRPMLPCTPPLALRCPDHLQVAFAPEQMALQLDVLLANCRVIDAVELVHWHGHLTSQEQLLGCVMALTRKLNVWEARDQLELILQVPLSAADRRAAG
ncbi:hypothetical protein V5799_008243 [Amblyomma americanum]|uniref:ELYS-like domain-containing protein n=1 Tax=Amblyomma americanum TaxID=6943 RepID=A0AAQ4FDY2_AMBAM